MSTLAAQSYGAAGPSTEKDPRLRARKRDADGIQSILGVEQSVGESQVEFAGVVRALKIPENGT